MSDPMTKKARDAAEAVEDVVKTAAADARATARRTAKTAQDAAKKTTRTARKTTAALSGKAAAALHEQAGKFDEDAVGHRLLESVAGGMESLSGQLRDGNLGQLIAEAEGFARRNPLMFIAGAALAGFAIARMTQPRGHRDEAL